MGKQRSQPGGASALDYRFFDLQQKADGLFQIALAYQNDVIGQRLYEFAGQFARLLDGNALSQRVAFAGKVLTPHLGVHRRIKRSEERRVGKGCVSTVSSRWAP